MIGFVFNFENNDFDVDTSGTIITNSIDSQNCALIAVSELCRLTAPEVGARLAARLINRRARSARKDIAEAERMVERDGAKRVRIYLNTDGTLQFTADYGTV